jgi:tripartite-type tricarboxylate transporter receptor subunit TctC
MLMNRRAALVRGGALLAALQAPTVTRATALKGRLIYGFTGGGVASIVGDALTDALRDNGIADLKMAYLPGNGSRQAQEAVRAAAPDGATLLFNSSTSITLFPWLYKRLNYDIKDFTAIAPLYSFTRIFAVGPRVPMSVQTIADYVTWVQANPSHANVGIPAIGSGAHFVVSALAQARNVVLRPVAYRGSAASAKDLGGGSLPAAVTMIGQSADLFAAGVLRPLAVASPARWPSLPQVPTLSEQGVPDCEVTEWHGVMGPAQMDQVLVKRLSEGIRHAVRQGPTRQWIDKLGLGATDVSPSEYTDMLQKDAARWQKTVQKTRFSATE